MAKNSFPVPEISWHPCPIQKENHEVRFSILIPSWNNLEMLQCCIKSVNENSAFSHQIIVHVNEGTDGTLEWIQNQSLDFSFSPQNAGVCYAVNAMAKMAKTDYLLYLNDDMYVCKNWDVPFWKEIQTRPDHLWYLSGTMIEPVTSSNQCVLSPHHFGRHPKEFLQKELDLFVSLKEKPDWFGACWPPSLVHRQLFEKVGGYSVEFSPGMYSDPDFGMKLWQEGVRHFKGLGKSLIYHFQSRSTGRVKRNNGRLQFAQKWGIPSSWFYKQMLRMGMEFNENKPLKPLSGFHLFIARLKALWITIKG